MSNNGNGHTGFNGNSLASLSGARVRLEEHVIIESSSLREAMDTIRRIAGTGQLSISFLNGSPAGTVEWKTTRKNNA